MFLLKCQLFILTAILGLYSIAFSQSNKENDVTLENLLKVKISTAAKYEQTTSEAPASVTIITSENIDRYGYRTLEEAFQSVRGFYTSYDRNYGYLGVRGFSRPTDYNNRVLVLINGQTINEPVYQSVDIGTELPINMDIIERIEIVRGPGSALYGTSAMFAVVNIITKNTDTFEGLRLSAENGSHARYEGNASFGKEFSNGAEFIISGQWADIDGQNLYFKEYDDPSTNNGLAENLDWDKYYRVFAALNYHNFKFQAIGSSRKKGIPTGAYEMAFNADAANTQDDHVIIQLSFDRKVSPDKNIMLRGYFDHYHYDGVYPYEDFDEGGKPYIYNSLESDNANRVGGELQFRWDLHSNNRLTVGTEYQNSLRADYRAWDEWETYFDGDFPYQTLAFYAQEELQATKNLSFTAGIRWDKYSNIGSRATPRGAIVYNPLKSATLKLLYGEAFRSPSIYEVNYEDPVFGWKANLGLKSEKIRTSELIWEQRLSDALFGAVSVYNYKMNNLIDPAIDPSDSLVQYQNIGKVNAYGLEFEFKARLKIGLQGYANYAFQRAEETASKQKLSNSPSHLAKIGLSYPVMKHFYAAAELQYESERITVYDTKTDAFLLTNLKISSKLLFNHIKSSLLIRNLFDVAYETPGGFEHLQPAFRQNGRNFDFKLEYKL